MCMIVRLTIMRCFLQLTGNIMQSDLDATNKSITEKVYFSSLLLKLD